MMRVLRLDNVELSCDENKISTFKVKIDSEFASI